MLYCNVGAFGETEIFTIQNNGKSGLFFQVLYRAVAAPVVRNDDFVVVKLCLFPNARKARFRVSKAVPGENNDGNRLVSPHQRRSPTFDWRWAC